MFAPLQIGTTQSGLNIKWDDIDQCCLFNGAIDFSLNKSQCDQILE